MKKCLFCAEEILDDAIKCKHCGEWNKEEPKGASLSKKAVGIFSFWKTFVQSSMALVVIFSLLNWRAGMFEDNFVETFLFILVFAGLIGVLVTYFIRGLKSVSKLSDEDKTKYNGLEGWLTLIGLALILNFGFSLYYLLYEIYEILSDIRILESLNILLELVILLFSIYLIYLFFSKKKVFPKWYIMFLIVSMVINIFSLVYIDVNDPEKQSISKNAGKSILSVMIWVPYMLKSKRVRATFIK